MNAEPTPQSVPSVPLASAEPGRWSVPGAILFAVIVVGTAMLSGFFMQQGYLAWRLGPSALLDPTASKQLATGEQRHLFVGIQLAAQILQLALIWLLAGLWHADRKAALGLKRPNHGLGGWFKAILLLFAVKIAATMLAAGISPQNVLKDAAPFGQVVQAPLALVGFLMAVMLAGATEELVFRGVLSRTLESTRVGFWGGAALASGSFAILHFQYGPTGQFVVFAIGMALAWIRMRSDSLWPAIVCHAINNGIAIVALKSLG